MSPGPISQQEHRRDRDELDDREDGRAAQIQQGRGEQIDLGLDGAILQATHGEDDPECGGAEEEDHRRRRDDRGCESWQGDRAEHDGGAGPESSGRLLGTTVQPLPHTPDGPHDDGEVEEDEGGQDAAPVPVKTQPSQWPAVGE
jgi:hypothetical protein